MGKKIILSVILFVLCIVFCSDKVEAKYCFDIKGQCEVSPNATLRIKVNADAFDGFDIYRADPNGVFQYVDYVGLKKNTQQQDSNRYQPEYDYEKNNFISEYTYEKKKYVEYRTYTFVDENLQVDQMYTYRVDGYHYEENEKRIVDSKTVTVTILAQGPTITVGKRNGKLGSVISWKNNNTDVDGYRIYMVKDYDDVSNYLNVDINDLSKYTLVKEINNPKTNTFKFSKLMNGVTYTYRVCSYKKQNGEIIESTMSEAKPVLMNYYSYDGESQLKKIKRAFGSEKKMIKNYKSASKASKQMKKIKIKVWDYKSGKKGKKVTRTKYIVVNKKLAPSITQMFKEIYKCKEKQVINDIGCYSYRQGQHMYGLAIDINPNENYMIDNGTILSGSYWKPKKDPYSIPANCETVRILRRYGFYRGEWGNRKDYMHFSYFGT